jgi:hypothetical protein
MIFRGTDAERVRLPGMKSGSKNFRPPYIFLYFIVTTSPLVPTIPFPVAATFVLAQARFVPQLSASKNDATLTFVHAGKMQSAKRCNPYWLIALRFGPDDQLSPGKV